MLELTWTDHNCLSKSFSGRMLSKASRRHPRRKEYTPKPPECTRHPCTLCFPLWERWRISTSCYSGHAPWELRCQLGIFHPGAYCGVWWGMGCFWRFLDSDCDWMPIETDSVLAGMSQNTKNGKIGFHAPSKKVLTFCFRVVVVKDGRGRKDSEGLWVNLSLRNLKSSRI